MFKSIPRIFRFISPLFKIRIGLQAEIIAVPRKYSSVLISRFLGGANCEAEDYHSAEK